eukprot:6208574-Pyramimonas_sp.AAC.1
MGLQQRKNKLRALIRGSKGKVRALWRTGLLPAAARGSGTGGVDSTLAKLRSMAGLLVGARQHAGLAAWLATQADEFYDPIYDITIGSVRRYAALFWDNIGSMARLQRGWEQLMRTFVD